MRVFGRAPPFAQTSALLRAHRASDTPDALRGWAREILRESLASHPPTVAEIPKRGFFARLARLWLPKRAEITDAAALREFITLARELPVDRQAATLDAFLRQNPKTLMNDRDADVRAAREELQSWVMDLESKGVAGARRKLGAVFLRSRAHAGSSGHRLSGLDDKSRAIEGYDGNPP